MTNGGASEETVRCGKCGVAMAVATADISPNGYRCLSCATDDKIAASAEESRKEAQRDGAITQFRVILPAVLLTGGLTLALQGDGRWIAAGLLAATLLWGGLVVRGLWRRG